MFREAHEFWKLHLNTKQQVIDEIVDTEPIEEVKIEVLDHEYDAYHTDYLEYTTEDVIFVEEPTIVDNEITSLDIVKLEENIDVLKHGGNDNETYQKSNIIIKENRKPMANRLKTMKRSVFDCDVEFLEDKTSSVIKSNTTSFSPFTGSKSVSDEGIPIFDCDMCDKGKFNIFILNPC